ncbi:MAG: hypothetical protein DRP78_04905 [Candidatus Omnitrophota bacterium]|nr:MAG: hypothetical protein DRP78_04905 [Candidatus Omnitrophota bacterium]
MPNTKINFKSGIIGGIIAGTIYQVVQWAYINFQVGVAKYNAIYGSFAALPLFLAWLQISWLILFLGAEISFAHQNVEMFEFEPQRVRLSHYFKRLIGLRIMHLLIKNFSQKALPLTSRSIASVLEIPIRLVNRIVYELITAGLVSEVKTEVDKESAYQPACSTDVFTIKYVLDVLDHNGLENISMAQSKELNVLSQALADFANTTRKCSANMLLREI